MTRGLVLLTLLAFVWGSNWPVMKVVLEEAPVITFRALCLVVSGPSMLLLARANGERLRLRRHDIGPLLLISFFNITAWFLLSAFGLKYMEAGRAAIIAYTMPIWALVPAWLMLGERPTAARLGGLALGVVALAALIAPGAAAIGRAPLGPMLMLLGAALWAIGTVLIKRLRPAMSVLQFSGWQIVLGGLPLVFAALLFERPGAMLEVSAQTALLAVYVIAVPVTIGQFLWLKIVDVLPVTVATVGSLAVPVVGVLSSALWLGEAVQATDALALVLVLAALGLILRPPAAPRASRQDRAVMP
jgi:drug/metabolite transporter (DMT)-like permease